MSGEDLKAKARRFYEEAWDEGKGAVIDELLGPDFVYHAHRQADVMTREQYKQYCLDSRANWAPVHLVIDEMLDGGDLVAARGTWSGTWSKGERWGVPATGNRGTMHWVSVFRFASGKIVELWNNYDFLELLEMAGAIKS